MPSLPLSGQRDESIGIAPLNADVALDVLMANKAIDSDWIRTEREESETTTNALPKTGHTGHTLQPCDRSVAPIGAPSAAALLAL